MRIKSACSNVQFMLGNFSDTEREIKKLYEIMVPFSDKQIFLLLTSYSRGSKEVSSS